MPEQAPKICGITGRQLPAGEELWRIRLDAEEAKVLSADHQVELEPGMYAVCYAMACKYRERVARKRGVKDPTTIGLRELA